jgi:hydrophobe/amphiphile efflux-1 (HAE1) family protein
MQFKLEARGRLADVSEFADIVIRSTDRGRIVRLSDIADIELGSQSYGGTPKVNGNHSVALSISKQSNANALMIIREVERILKGMEPSLPKGMTWGLPYNSTLFVEAAMEEIQFTLFLTFALVMLITYIFLQDWRATLVPMVAIPISLIGTFAFMQVLGLSINTLTMFGLILAIGLVVDDAIIVVECCKRLIDEEGLTARDAAFQAMHELTGALVAATLVVVAMFSPVAFYGGMVGTIYQQFAATMCISLCLSLVVALTLSPAMCALVLRKAKPAWGPYKLINVGLDTVRGGYMLVGGFLARRAFIPAILIGCIICCNYVQFNRLPSAFIPSEDKGMLIGELMLPSGKALSQTQGVLDGLVKDVREIPGVKNVVSMPGMGMISGNGENFGVFFTSLDTWNNREIPWYKPKTPENDKSINTIVGKIVGKGMMLPDGMAIAFNPPPIMGLGLSGDVSFALQATGGQSTQEMADAINQLKTRLMATGKCSSTPTASFDASTPMLFLEVDRAKAEAMNVSVSSVFNTLQTQLGSAYVNDFNLYGKTYQVKLQSEIGFRENLNDIGQMTVPSRTGTLVPIDTLATVAWTTGPRQIERFNQFPSTIVRVGSNPGVSSGDMMKTIQDVVHAEDFPKNYQVSWTDLSYQESKNEGQIVYILALALVFAYLFLVAKYESWTTPVSVLLSVATGTLGSMTILLYLGRSMDIYSQLGLLMLISLVAKTVILMVEYSKKLRDEGMNLIDAAINGLKVRYRAVLMTALALILGLLPMVIATGAGAGSRRSIGITVFWGLIIATIFDIMLVPGLYVIIRSMSETTKKVVARLFGGSKTSSYSKGLPTE